MRKGGISPLYFAWQNFRPYLGGFDEKGRGLLFLSFPLMKILRTHCKITMATVKVNVLLFITLFMIISVVRSADPDCVYTVYVRTGSIIKAGTDSNMTLTLYDAAGYGIRINNLEAWGGLMGPGYNYFERGNLDIFSGKGPCLTGTPCEMNITSDGTGSHHGWYCNYIEVTTTGAHIPCAQQSFTVEQWLATDTLPYELTAVRDYCSASDNGDKRRVIRESGSSLRSIV